MKFIITSLFTALICLSSFAQNNQLVKSGDSDPAAKAVLDQMRKKYEAYNSMEAQFELEIEFPEQPKETQPITIQQQGERYRLEMPGRTIISDGTTLWMVLENNMEVQINNVPDDEDDMGIFSPQALFKIYEKDEFVYFLTNETTENGRTVQQIEFKPIDRNSDYSKLRLTVDKSTKDLKRLRAFGKDGTRYGLIVKKQYPNKSIAANRFIFNKADYPDYYIEDLR